MENTQNIKKFVMNRPKVVAAYGYGSGVFKQSGYTDKDKPQIDLILVVDDLKKWHLENMKKNPRDYSFTGKLFFKYASVSKLKGLTGITYLSNIKEDGSIYKYGTIEKNDLVSYLETWNSFYLPGRFQKRILPIIDSKEIEVANEKNRNAVLLVALLTLPMNRNKLIDVYTGICGLSYLGDTRMKFAENPRKVLNIVEGSYDSLNEIYGKECPYFKILKDEKIEIAREKIIKDISLLPSGLLEYLENEKDLQVVREKIISYFTELNKKESSKQTLKGLFTNGIIRSIQYASKKVMKKIHH
jgi:translocator assembly and maintenance protein 41